jgi:hypothetical protein
MDKLGLSPSFIDWVWSDYIFKLGLNQSLTINVQSQAQWAVDTQMSKYRRVSNINDFVDSRALIQVDAGAVNIPL